MNPDTNRKNITIQGDGLMRLQQAQTKLSNQLGWRVTLNQTIQHLAITYLQSHD